MLDGVAQKPLEGVSMRYSWDSPDVPTRKQVQYYEILGQRAIWAGGWKAVTTHQPSADTAGFERDVWELYHTDVDPGETRNLAEQYPDQLRVLVDRWWTEAGKYQVLPLDDRAQQRLGQTARTSSRLVLAPNTTPVPGVIAPRVLNHTHRITVEADIPAGGAAGVLVAHGSRFGGYALFVKDGRLTYVHNYTGLEELTLTASAALPSGPATICYEFTVSGPPDPRQGRGTPGSARLSVNGQSIGEAHFPYTTLITFDNNQGLSAGRGGPLAVSRNYSGAFPFNGTIKQVVLEVEPTPEERQRAAEQQIALAQQ
jgi:arylsulfatase